MFLFRGTVQARFGLGPARSGRVLPETRSTSDVLQTRFQCSFCLLDSHFSARLVTDDHFHLRMYSIGLRQGPNLFRF